MQGQITTPFSSPHVVPTEPSSKARSAAHLCVNKKKQQLRSCLEGIETKILHFLYTIFSHHYTTHWFVALHFLYSVCGVAFFYTLHCRVKMVKSWNNGAEKPWARSTDTPATTALHPLLWFSFSLYIYKLEQKRKATWSHWAKGLPLAAWCCASVRWFRPM